MTKGHAQRTRESMAEHHAAFRAAIERGDKDAALKAWGHLARIADGVASESERSRIEADALAAELEMYRAVRSDRPAAPNLPDHEYVFTASFPWVCAAGVRREMVYIRAGAGYHQECQTPEKTTLCGKKTAFPVSERFTSGGWPRMHELCPDCLRKLDGLGLLGDPKPAPADVSMPLFARTV